MSDLRTAQDLRDDRNESRIMEYDSMQRDKPKTERKSIYTPRRDYQSIISNY